MTSLENLKPAEGSLHREKRIGRGQGSGHGGTSTRGHKGMKSRSGYSRKRGHEGGQTPIQMRLPKRGFKNYNRTVYNTLSLSSLQHIADKHGLSTIDVDKLRELNLVQKFDKVKVLGSGTLSKALSVNVHAYTESAKKAIEEQGGTASILGA